MFLMLTPCVINYLWWYWQVPNLCSYPHLSNIFNTYFSIIFFLFFWEFHYASWSYSLPISSPTQSQTQRPPNLPIFLPQVHFLLFFFPLRMSYICRMCIDVSMHCCDLHACPLGSPHPFFIPTLCCHFFVVATNKHLSSISTLHVHTGVWLSTRAWAI